MSDADMPALGAVDGARDGTPLELETVAGQGLIVPPELEGTTHRGFEPSYLIAQLLPPLVVFVLLMLAWEYGVKALNIPAYTFPQLSKILQTMPTIDTLKSDAWYTSAHEALPGFLLGSTAGFLMAVLAVRFRFLARGILPYAVVSNSMPIIGIAPIAVVLFGDAWQSKAVIVAILTFFPMLINAYKGLMSADPLSLQLMRSYAANGRDMFFKVRLPASLPYVFNGLKINTTLAIIGAIVGEYFGGPVEGLGSYIHNQSGELAMPQVWSAVIVACLIGIAAYMVIVVLEHRFTSWHVSYRSGR